MSRVSTALESRNAGRFWSKMLKGIPAGLTLLRDEKCPGLGGGWPVKELGSLEELESLTVQAVQVLLGHG